MSNLPFVLFPFDFAQGRLSVKKKRSADRNKLILADSSWNGRRVGALKRVQRLITVCHTISPKLLNTYIYAIRRVNNQGKNINSL
jgi:hypothetical protein